MRESGSASTHIICSTICDAVHIQQFNLNAAKWAFSPSSRIPRRVFGITQQKEEKHFFFKNQVSCY
jgi:hypothetical protein